MMDRCDQEAPHESTTPTNAHTVFAGSKTQEGDATTPVFLVTAGEHAKARHSATARDQRGRARGRAS